MWVNYGMPHFLYADDYVTSVFCFLYQDILEPCNANSVVTEYIQTIFPLSRGPHKSGVWFFFSDIIDLLLKSTLSIPNIFFQIQVSKLSFNEIV